MEPKRKQEEGRSGSGEGPRPPGEWRVPEKWGTARIRKGRVDQGLRADCHESQPEHFEVGMGFEKKKVLFSGRAKSLGGKSVVSEAGVVVYVGGGDRVTFPSASGSLPSFPRLISPPSVLHTFCLRVSRSFLSLPLRLSTFGEGWGQELRFPETRTRSTSRPTFLFCFFGCVWGGWKGEEWI